MDISQIKDNLGNSDPQQRLKAITELGNYESDVAVPILLTKKQDPEFLVRSFVAMGLGKKRTADSFAALLEMMKLDKDPNVRAEASNSLSLFGEAAAPHLCLLFHQDDNWLVRRSILAALMELNCPEERFEVSVCGLTGEDFTVQEASVAVLGS
ncbi:MAG: HEAT repeat domain-containing protein, partial [Cyanobacteria bacterium P01_G01_bin.49]